MSVLVHSLSIIDREVSGVLIEGVLISPGCSVLSPIAVPHRPSPHHRREPAVGIAGLALDPAQPRRRVLQKQLWYGTGPCPGAVLTASLSNGIIQSAINNLAWHSWKDNYFANQTFSVQVLELGNLPAHNQIDNDLTLGFLGSWDSTDSYMLPSPIT